MAKYSIQQHPAETKVGFTIVELAVVVLIIGVLVTIMVPVLTHRSAEAKLAVARMELQQLGDAQERAHTDTGYMYRLDVLNDGAKYDYVANTAYDNVIQGVMDNAITTNNLYGSVAPFTIFISIDTQSFPPNQMAQFTRMLRDETSFGWKGPYLNFGRDVNHNDWPDDPWGNDYLLFTINGAIYPPVDSQLAIQQQGWQFRTKGPLVQAHDNAGGTIDYSYNAAYIFDRPTLLSLGPNRLPGNGTTNIGDGYGQGDDIIYTFGSN